MTDSNQQSPSGNTLGWWLAGIAGFVVIAQIVGGQEKSNVETASTNPSPIAASTPADVQLTPQPPLPLDISAAERGYGQFQQVAQAHVPGSSEIYSQNCYEALGKPLDWHDLDRCGAYDALAVRWTELNEDYAGQDDLTYFQSEAAATRYLAAATAGGLPGTEADARWDAIERMAQKTHLASKAPNPDLTPAPTINDQSNDNVDDDSTNSAGPAED